MPNIIDFKLGLVKILPNFELIGFRCIRRLNIKAMIAGKNITSPSLLKPTLGFENIKKAKNQEHIRTTNM